MELDWRSLEPPDAHPFNPIAYEVTGPRACFTRPEANAERLSYPVPTPSALSGLTASIYGHPQVRWQVHQIEVLAPLRWGSLRRNETARPGSREDLKRGYLDADGAVQQRMTSFLRDVHYRVFVHAWVHPEARETNEAKYRDQLTRRIERGQHFRQPALGMREFFADVSPLTEAKPIDWTEDLGIMLHSIAFDDVAGTESYDYFRARIDQGVIRVPALGMLGEQRRLIA